MQFIQNASTANVKRYTAISYLLGIRNYNDESKISLCIYEGCQYEMLWTLQVHSNGTQTLDLETYYEGGAHLNENQMITSLTFYTQDGTFSYKFGSGIEIAKTGRQTFVLKSSGEQQEEEIQEQAREQIEIEA